MRMRMQKGEPVYQLFNGRFPIIRFALITIILFIVYTLLFLLLFVAITEYNQLYYQNYDAKTM